MICKTIEIRDSMTFIPAMAIKMVSWNPGDSYLLRRMGFVAEFMSPAILFVWISRGRCESDPNAWSSRTLGVAHQYVQEHFDELEAGAVVDVEFILGITKEPKRSERLEESPWLGKAKKTDDTNSQQEG